MKAVIYARFSSDKQNEQSIEGQLRECKEYADKKDITIVSTYIDRAMSAKTDNRPEFQRMIKDSAKQLFDAVIVWKLDRFARNRYDSAHYKAILRKNGVKVISAKESISEGAEGIILEAMLEGMAEYYSAELSEKVTRGMTENALKCKYNGGTMPLGYMTDENKFYIINPQTAPIVQEIFTRYADGETVTEIIQTLNDRGLKSTKKASFNKSSLHSILKNRRYIGEYSYNGIVKPDSMPCIVSKELFEKVQKITAKNKRAPARQKAKMDYLLTTKLFCGMCNAFMVGESGRGYSGNVHYYYKCATAKKHRTCKKKTVKKEYIERLVVEETCNTVFKDDVIERLANSLVELQGKENTMLPLLQKQLAEVQKGIDNMLNAIQQGIINTSTKQRLDDLEEEKSKLEASIIQEQIQKPLLTREQIIFWISKFKGGDIDSIDYCRTIIDIFVNSVYLYDDKMLINYNYKDGTKTINLSETVRSDLEQHGSPTSYNPNTIVLDKYFGNIAKIT